MTVMANFKRFGGSGRGVNLSQLILFGVEIDKEFNEKLQLACKTSGRSELQLGLK